MIKSLSIQHFRGFNELKIDSLEPVNLIIGKNNVGKSALLEALFLILGSNPELTLRLNTFRGRDSLPLDIDELWGWLFYQRITQIPITLKCIDHSTEEHQLTISLEFVKTTQISSQNKPDIVAEQQLTLTSGMENKILKMVYTRANQLPLEITAKIDTSGDKIGINIENPPYLPFPLSHYLSTNKPVLPHENAKIFSKLETIGQHEEIIDILKIIEPRLKRLTVLAPGNMPYIAGDFGTKLLLPISYMGDGINRLLSFLLAIASAQKGGCVLIDEIENGLHYSVMQQVFAAVGTFAKRRDTQIIATTHSLECVKAAHQTYQNNANYDFRLYRLERENEEIKVISYNKETLETSLNAEWEIR